ncbi:MAG: hypothetical protein ACLGJB_05770 [Blastocatellia bacterium]
MKNRKALRHVVIGMLAVLTFTLTTVRGSGQQPDLKQSLIEKVNQSSSVRTRVENSEEAPVKISESVSKEISTADYQALVGITATADKLASYPDVRLLNTTKKRITTFTLFLKNELTNEMRFLRVSGPTIEPQSDYFVDAVRWVRRDKQSQPQPDWSSEKMWLLGTANDLVVKVGYVKFSDGSEWTLKETTSPINSGARISRVGFFIPRSPYSLTKKPLVSPSPSCVCDCGALCQGGGVCDCAGSCGSCTRFEDCTGCSSNCCSSACATECHLLNGAISREKFNHKPGLIVAHRLTKAATQTDKI